MEEDRNEEDVAVEDEEEEEEEKESTKNKILRLVAQVASKVKEIIGNLITTAGQVVVTILLGLTGEQRSAPHRQLYIFDIILTLSIDFCNVSKKKQNFFQTGKSGLKAPVPNNGLS